MIARTGRGGTLLLVLTLTGLLAGCVPGPETPDGDGCSVLTAGDNEAAGEPRVAVLLDVSGSTRAAAADQARPRYAAALKATIADAVNTGARVSIGSFDGGSGTVRWTVRDQPTDSGLNNPKRQQQHATRVKECLATKLAETAADSPAAAGTNVLGAIRAARDWIHAGGAGGVISVASDGLPTTGCADLTRTDFSGDREAAAIVNVCLQRKEIEPNMLDQTELRMYGIGRPAPDQPVAQPDQLAWLEGLWTDLCRAASAKKCDEISTEDPGREQGETSMPDTVPDGVVGFARVWHFVVPEAALFDDGAPGLRPGAPDHLINIAVALRTMPGARVLVAGHADSNGGTRYNQDLSERRATAVGDFLRRNGVPNPEVKGYGETRPLCRTTDAQCLQRNRRVEITASLR